MSEWKEYRLGDILSIKSGFSYKGKYIGTGNSLLLGMGCVSFKEKFLMSGARPYSGPYDQRYKVHSGDIVLATRQQSDNLPILAMPAMVPDSLQDKDIVIGTNLYKVEINDTTFSNVFIYWLLKTKQYVNYIAGVKTGTTVSMVTKKNVEDFTFFAPTNPKEREEIVSIISYLDDKIAVNRRICENLETQAQALFKYWFIDFAPFKNGKFVESELGMIPEGWRVGTLSDILNNIKDTIKQGDYPEFPYLPIDSIPMNSFLVNDVKDNSEAQSSLILFRKYDILVGAMRVYFHRVVPAPFDGITRSTCFVLRPKVRDYYSFALCSVNSNQAILHAQKTSKGSTMPYAVWEGGLGAFSIVIPPESVAKDFNLLIKKDVEMIQTFFFENQRLATLRDTLLPRLMSGELQVNETDR